mgnify:CR=1 FL=1
MKLRMTLLTLFFILAGTGLVAFLLHGYVFSIYEVTLTEVSKVVKAGDTVEITVVPINGLGFRPPLRKAPFELEFRKGEALAEPAGGSTSEGSVKLKCLKPGRVEVLVIPEHALKPTIVEFEIK